jgi:DNA primase
MIDTAELKERADLLAIVEADLGAPAKRAGQAWQWPCPYHPDGDSPSLTVYPDGRYHCFGCGADGDAITWLEKREGLGFREACERLGAGELQRPRGSRPAPARPRPVVELKSAPAPTWQARAAAVIDECQAALFSPAGDRARAWLAERGITQDVAKAWGIGLQAKAEDWSKDHQCWGRFEAASAWDRPGKAVFLAYGIVIPCVIGDVPWYLKIRAPQGTKYQHVGGGSPALFGADKMQGRRDLFLCEGELDAMLLHYYAGDVADVVTFGSASDRELCTWLPWLLPAHRVWLAFDNDKAGEEATAAWLARTKRARRAAPPAGRDTDITDAWRGGYDLRAWALSYIEAEAPASRAAEVPAEEPAPPMEAEQPPALAPRSEELPCDKHRTFWRRPAYMGGGLVCATCHPDLAGVAEGYTERT